MGENLQTAREWVEEQEGWYERQMQGWLGTGAVAEIPAHLTIQEVHAAQREIWREKQEAFWAHLKTFTEPYVLLTTYDPKTLNSRQEWESLAVPVSVIERLMADGG